MEAPLSPAVEGWSAARCGDASLCSADDRPYSPQRRVPPLPSFIQSGADGGGYSQVEASASS